MKLTTFLTILILLTGCQEEAAKEERASEIETNQKANPDSTEAESQRIDAEEENETEESIEVRGEIDSLVINESSVIFLMPDSLEIEELKKQYDDASYSEIIADMSWYPGLASEMLDSFDIENVYSSKSLIILKGSGNKEYRYKRKEVEGDMILFNREKDPKLTYSAMFQRDSVLNYFEKK